MSETEVTERAVKEAGENARRRRVRNLIDTLKSPHLDDRWKAAGQLGEIGDGSAVPALIEALSDPFVDVSWIAAKSLGEIGDDRRSSPSSWHSGPRRNGSASALRPGWAGWGTGGQSRP